MIAGREPEQEKHLPHEAWHVVQQAQGRVKPTMQLKGGAFVNDEAGLEREADLFGAKALASAAAAQPANSAALPQGRLVPVQRRGSGAVIQAALVNPVYAGGTKPTTVSLALGVGDWPPFGSAPAASPDGWAQIVALGLTAGWVRFHVLNQDAGGAGAANNLVPTTQQINQCATWKGFEKWVKMFSQPALAGVGMPFASTFNAAIAYHTAAEDCVYRNAAGIQIPVRGVDFPAVIVATLNVPGGGGLAAHKYAANLGNADGLLRPNQFAPPGWALVVAPAPAAAPAAAAAAVAAPVPAAAAAPVAAAAPAAVPMQMRARDPGAWRLEPL